ncbi:SDR family NAD(P)-dependent oxidoreductase [Roseateles toxinivorans]|uniref:NAD(P)-dependent dehydrogenase (Short-subunit alcohol dehydrogenase family) n=1 Tax=Roseateles toxinivorans TaxID=270368 RepID=A0A4R6QRB1_9BURK|nr:SDR family oxidoreductase [Roseateles toxinivorans]TDP72658.1 NAD(P)-dependent dehydrogenase (short-subunit alcohol dehydrogenase family) [Roseateles toxinivorans]
MDLQLKGLRAIVTGGSAGIGAAVVRALAAEGCDVAFCARTPARIDAALSALQGLPGRVQAEAVDVTDTAQFQAWLARLGEFDIFVANVSALSGDWTAALATDIRATVDATEAALPYLQRSPRAALTYIGSKAGSLAAPNSAAYGAAKAAMAHYMKSLSARLLPGVRVNTVSPGDTLFDGGLWDRVRRDEPEAFQKVLQRNPMQRLATAEEIARVVAFVSSPAASFVAGANWYVDGGSVQHVQI